MMKLSGVYIIQNLVNQKVYIGASKDLKPRLWQHKWMLRRNEHHNIHLQGAYNYYGEKNFEFAILEECEEQFIFSLENYWCNMLNSHSREHGYNVDLTSPIGKLKVNQETRTRMSESAEKRPIDCYTVYGEYHCSFSDLYKCAEYFNAVAPNIHRRMNVVTNKKNLIDSEITKYIIVDKGMSIDQVKSHWSNVFRRLKSSPVGKYSVYDCFGKFITKTDSQSISMILGVTLSSVSSAVNGNRHLKTLKIKK
jgi:group I intron endonuclease